MVQSISYVYKFTREVSKNMKQATASMMIIQGKEIISKEIMARIIIYTMRKKMKGCIQKSICHNKDLSNKLKLKRYK